MIDMKKNVLRWFISLLLLMMFCGNPVTLIVALSWFVWNCTNLFTN